jgi:hypothetical protein
MGWLSDIKDKFVDDIIPNEVKSGSAAKKAIRNLIPNELADIAVKAAPFVAPFQPGIAAAMRGIGRFDQRGSISDALKQGAATYGFGKAANYGLSKIPTGSGGSMLKTSTDLGTKIAENRGIKTLTNLKDNVKETTGDMYKGIKEKAKEFGVDKYFLGEDGEFQFSDVTKFLSDPKKTVPMTMLATYIKEKFFPGETQDNPYNVALGKRGDDVASYLRQYGEFDPTRDPNTDPFSDAEKEQFVTDNIVEYRNLPEYATGGRVNYGLGSFFSSPTASTVVNPTGGGTGKADPEVILDIFKEKFSGFGGGKDITKEDIMEAVTSKMPMGGGMNSGLSGLLPGLMGKTLREMNFDSDEDEEERDEAAYGGRMGYYDGGDAYDPDAIFKRYEQKILKDRGYDPSSPTKYGKDVDSGIRTLQDILNVLFKDEYAMGGRVNYASGSDIEEILMASEPDPMDERNQVMESIAIKEFGKSLNELSDDEIIQIEMMIDEMAQTGNQPGKMASMDDDYEQEFMRLVGEFMENGFSQQEAIEAAKDELERLRGKFMATGGRVNYAFGTKPDVVDQAAGIEGLDININPQGIKELDLRETGGFIPPVGVKEKADDIPAMLSNNEFVFTADAVREAGDGDVDKGAERMYSMMKRLENGGRV